MHHSNQNCSLSLFCLISIALLSTAHALTTAEADSLVAAEVASRAEEKAHRKAQALSKVASEEIEHVRTGGQKVILRRIPAFKAVQAQVAAPDTDSASQEAAIEAAIQITDEKRRVMSWQGVVYDGRVSEFKTNLSGTDYTIWANIDLNLISGVRSFNFEDVHYTNFCFSRNITEEEEHKRVRLAAEAGRDYESRWKSPPVQLSLNQSEYVILTKDASEIPAELYEQVDALIGYYTQNMHMLERLQDEQALIRAARERHRRNNQEIQEDIVINYWPIQSGLAR